MHNPRRLRHSNILTYTVICIIYADKSVSVRGTIRKFGKDKSSEK